MLSQKNMSLVKIKDARLRQAVLSGIDEFVKVFIDAINDSIGGELNAETMAELNADQTTLLAYDILRNEVMDGGFVQLIHNGYGGFMFLNPVAKALEGWGIEDLAHLVKKAGKLYRKHREDIESDCTDDEFMALFEQHSEFDELDDDFVENEEEWTGMVAHYIDEHIDHFTVVES